MNAPVWYFLNGQTGTGMGYREATDNIGIVLRTVICRQYLSAATYHKTAAMGWVNLHTGVLLGGLAANLERHERQLSQMLGSGAQVWLRGTRLEVTPKTQARMAKWTVWFKRHRDVIAGDILHLCRPGGALAQLLPQPQSNWPGAGSLERINSAAGAGEKELADTP